MKFETYEEKIARQDRLGRWHQWFAWYPVVLDNGYVAWLRWVERQITFGSTDMGDYDCRFYRSLDEQSPETTKPPKGP